LWWHDKKDVTLISTYHAAEVQKVVKRGKEKQTPVCVIHYNQHMGGIDKKDQRLQTYLVERKIMNKWYMKLIRRLLNTTVLNYLVTYRQNIGQNVDHLKFRIDLHEGLLVKNSVQHRISGNHDGYKTIKRLTERHFPRTVPPTEKKCKPTDSVLSAASITREERLCTTVKIVMLLCASMGVLRPPIQGKTTEVMYTECILSTIYRKLPY
jgi:hypothetical protein